MHYWRWEKTRKTEKSEKPVSMITMGRISGQFTNLCLFALHVTSIEFTTNSNGVIKL